MSEAWRGGSTRAWRRTRALVLVRDGYTCQLRLDGCTTQATHVHHTAGRSVTGDNPTYLVASCEHCNLTLGDPTKHTDPPNKPVTQW
jgi:5-methylcytosine-specific restriction endonuclease McrA